jgi:hypothetical protein
MECFHRVIRLTGNHGKALDDLASVVILPPVPNTTEGEEPVIRERNRVRLLRFLVDWLPLIEELPRDETSAPLEGLSPRATVQELVGPRIDAFKSSRSR